MKTPVTSFAPDHDRPVTPHYTTVQKWCALTGMGNTSTYAELSKGNLRAVKCGRRTLIDVDHGLAWLRSLPQADIRMGKRNAA